MRSNQLSYAPVCTGAGVLPQIQLIYHTIFGGALSIKNTALSDFFAENSGMRVGGRAPAARKLRRGIYAARAEYNSVYIFFQRSDMRAYHAMTAEETLAALGSGECGISEGEAQTRLRRSGENALRGKKRGGAFMLFFAQFKDFMTVLLICAAAVSGVVAYVTGDVHELADTGILLFIILLNSIVGFIQQYRADNAVEKLKKLSVCRVKAVREGKDILLDSTSLVPGDVIYLEEGDMVPADCRLLSCEELRCDESALTGESRGVGKSVQRCPENAPVGDRRDMLFSSTFVVAVAAVIFVFGIFFKDSSLAGNFMSSVAIAVAAIPEGMPAIVTVIMALGVQKMSRERAIVRKLHAVETLGGCSCICSDKTGTLTENRMTVEAVCTDFSAPPLRELHAFAPRTGAGRMLLACMRVCNTVKGEGAKRIGDATEVALVHFADACGFAFPFKKLASLPFTSERRMMTVSAQAEEGRFDFVKGAADVLLEKCTRIREGETVRPLTEADRAAVRACTEKLAGEALRVLGFAYGEYGGAPREEGLIFLGVCGMIDPPRRGVKEAVAACKGAGITPVMITGDHRETAFAIAKRLGIASSGEEVMTGDALDSLPEAELGRRVPQARVFARVSPKHKSMIVEKFQNAGNVVAMTGDGINDAPGIRRADIGIAMGISGTDVTKSAADMVIADDNFATIVTAVREGRHVFSNIKKTILFFLATNFAEVLSILIATLVLWRLDFLTSTQLLWINLITDSLPVLSLGAEAEDADCMLRPPRRANDLFSPESIASVAVYGLIQTALCVGVFARSAAAFGNAAAVTMTFFVLSFLELFHSFNIRSERRSAFGKGFFSNRMLFLTVFIGIAVNMLLCAFAPLRAAFGIVPLSAAQWGIVFAASLAVIPAAELYKAVVRAAVRAKGRKKGARGAKGGKGKTCSGHANAAA